MVVTTDGAGRRDDRRDDVVDALAGRIAALRVGDRLPGEAQLMRQFGVPRSAARAAIDRLVACHLVRRVQGAGTFVHRRFDIPIDGARVVSFHDAVSAAGGRPRTVVTSADDHDPPDLARAAFDGGRLPGGERQTGAPACRIERLGFIDDEECAVLEHWVHPMAIPEPAVAARVYESLGDAARAAGLSLECVLRRATTEPAPRRVCGRLGLPALSETWLMQTACVDAASGRPAYFARMWARTDVMRLVYSGGPQR